jgi:hypothetical protein
MTLGLRHPPGAPRLEQCDDRGPALDAEPLVKKPKSENPPARARSCAPLGPLLSKLHDSGADLRSRLSPIRTPAAPCTYRFLTSAARASVAAVGRPGSEMDWLAKARIAPPSDGHGQTPRRSVTVKRLTRSEVRHCLFKPQGLLRHHSTPSDVMHPHRVHDRTETKRGEALLDLELLQFGSLSTNNVVPSGTGVKVKKVSKSLPLLNLSRRLRCGASNV